MREIVGAGAVIDGTATSISGVRVARPLPAADPAHEAAGDFTARLSLPSSARSFPTRRSTRAESTTRRARAPTTSPSGSPTSGSCSSATRTTAATALRTSTGSSGRSAGASRTVSAPSRRTAPISAANRAFPATRGARSPRSTASTGPAGSSSSALWLGTWYFAFNHNRPAFKGPGQIPLKKAINFAIDRPALARTFGYLFGKRTDQMLPPALARRRASIRSAERPDDRAALVRESTVQAEQARPLRLEHRRRPSLRPRCSSSTCEQLGIDLEVKFFDVGRRLREGPAPGRAVRHRPRRLGRRLPRPRGRSSVPLLDPATGRHESDRTIRAFADGWRRRTALTGEARRRRGPTSTST